MGKSSSYLFQAPICCLTPAKSAKLAGPPRALMPENGGGVVTATLLIGMSELKRTSACASGKGLIPLFWRVVLSEKPSISSPNAHLTESCLPSILKEYRDCSAKVLGVWSPS